jgi:MOSC domain-containing protein YiiM
MRKSPGVVTGLVTGVNVGTPQQVWWDDMRSTAIRKTPVEGPVPVGALGLSGDQVADTRAHGGTFQAVYAYSEEDYAWWSAELGVTLLPPTFGENLTTRGIDLNDAVMGETWRVGSTLLQVVSVRIPCSTFRGWMGQQAGVDTRGWVKRFTAEARPGPYLRVLQEGEIASGDGVEVVESPRHGRTVRDLFRALTTDPSSLARFADVEGLDPAIYAKLAGQPRS